MCSGRAGVLQRSAGNLERAVACYRTALQLRPSFPQALNNLAVVLTAQAGAPVRFFGHVA